MMLPKFQLNPNDSLKDQLHISLVPADIHLEDLKFPQSWLVMSVRDRDYHKIKPSTVDFDGDAIRFTNAKGERFQIDLVDLKDITVGSKSWRFYSKMMLFPIETLYRAVIAFQVRDGSHYYVTLPTFDFIPQLFDFAQQHNLQLNDPEDLQHHYDQIASIPKDWQQREI
ncbi:hypothetical protein PQ472_00300 [Lacticaseibacillus pabuli]|uniref:Uncharacterized protein n=1 Tax=Lacticaseibacillus pabuli TaxID=3025672 RepID=A0ABY7WRA2_9LACO|nr:hypothetical protein [Lacticaseibacillus sp. KACC 23028]WDF82713.1 hypothetical protein PQ472_00300 [Lacticaseibacillus sp. KACC 23028]